MMKLYTAEGHYDFSGFVILGVFDSMKKAYEECKKDEHGDYHSYKVNEFNLNND